MYKTLGAPVHIRGAGGGGQSANSPHLYRKPPKSVHKPDRTAR